MSPLEDQTLSMLVQDGMRKLYLSAGIKLSPKVSWPHLRIDMFSPFYWHLFRNLIPGVCDKHSKQHCIPHGHTHWAWVEADLLLGNLKETFTPRVLNSYDIVTIPRMDSEYIFLQGPLTVFQIESTSDLWQWMDLSVMDAVVDKKLSMFRCKGGNECFVEGFPERYFSYPALQNSQLAILAIQGTGWDYTLWTVRQQDLTNPPMIFVNTQSGGIRVLAPPRGCLYQTNYTAFSEEPARVLEAPPPVHSKRDAQQWGWNWTAKDQPRLSKVLETCTHFARQRGDTKWSLVSSGSCVKRWTMNDQKLCAEETSPVALHWTWVKHNFYDKEHVMEAGCPGSGISPSFDLWDNLTYNYIRCR